MSKYTGLKILIFLIAIFIAVWNYFLRTLFSLPYLSTLNSVTVYIIASGVLIFGVIFYRATRYSY
ncbi:hypothetical protein COU58_04425 [Candidatus Pacearchaeota archaeon CG10_big_fil_rev_8_21_14_0_10_32_42]|nr:MAG: hypothetical protein COU58_04425 [Candidatus Pacearchaeota archaeon CG10_big_fil_rev_8_21_14_0_10_32_42]